VLASDIKFFLDSVGVHIKTCTREEVSWLDLSVVLTAFCCFLCCTGPDPSCLVSTVEDNERSDKKHTLWAEVTGIRPMTLTVE
jgi:hypothetical protein